MSRELYIHAAGPGVSLQDMGRPGMLALGLSRGGAVDRLALWEGAALLQQPPGNAALELAGMGGVFESSADLRIALTGAPMRARIDGTPITWNSSMLLPRGARLEIGGAEAGSYGYLHVGGGFAGPAHLGSQSVHLTAGIGRAARPGDRIAIASEAQDLSHGFGLSVVPRFDGGIVRVVCGPQTALFPDEERVRFETTCFARDSRGNRMGVRLEPQGEGFASATGLSLLSEVIVPGDIQITGDGMPYVLLADCQTTGGYPRIGTVLPCDLPRVVQASPGAILQCRFVSLEEGRAINRSEQARWAALRHAVFALRRDPAALEDLLTTQLISGVTAGDDLERGELQ